MSKHDPKFRRFANLEGYLEKLSTNLLLGFQPKSLFALILGTGKFWTTDPKSATRISLMSQSSQKIFS